MVHRAGFAVHDPACPEHLAAECLADGLMTEADPEYRNLAAEMLYRGNGDARLFRCARAGRNQQAVGPHGRDLLDCDLVVAEDPDFRRLPALRRIGRRSS